MSKEEQIKKFLNKEKEKKEFILNIKTLPLQLQESIKEFEIALKNIKKDKSSKNRIIFADCIAELKSDINICQHGNTITDKEANYLRKKYLY